MPLPLAHAAAGLAIFLVTTGKNVDRPAQPQSGLLIAVFVVAANLADLDFLPGMLLGQPERFHHGLSHSLLSAAAFAALPVLFLIAWGKRIPGPGLVSGVLAATLSHPLLDFFSMDHSDPVGVPLFWPVSDSYLAVPWVLFQDVTRDASSNASFVTSLFNSHNAAGLLIELVFGTAVIFFALAIRHRETAALSRRYLACATALLPVLLVTRILVI